MFRYLVKAAIKATERLHQIMWKVSDWINSKMILTLENTTREDYPEWKHFLVNNIAVHIGVANAHLRFWWSDKLDDIERGLIKQHERVVRLRQWVENPEGLARALEPWVESRMDLLSEFQKEKLQKERNESWQTVRAFHWIMRKQIRALGEAIEALLELRQKLSATS